MKGDPAFQTLPDELTAAGVSWREYRGENTYVDPLRQVWHDRHDPKIWSHRTTPDRYLADPARPMTAAEWDMLQIPVGLAFFLRSSAGQVTGFYPSPAGATECRLDLAAWDRLAADHPLLAAMAPDVEAALICRTEGRVEHFLVPIDTCYELAGRMRLYWRGFDGGEQARQSIAEFLDSVRACARDMAAAIGRTGILRILRLKVFKLASAANSSILLATTRHGL